MESLINLVNETLVNETYLVGSQVCDIMEVTYLDNLTGISRQ